MTTSTINPNVPQFQSGLNSSVVRDNFAAAYNDINALWAVIPGVQPPRLREVTTPGTITMTSNDTGISVQNNGSSAVSVNLIAANNATGLPIVVVDSLGNAATHNITLVPNGSDTINGQSSYVIGSAYGSVTMYPITGGWSITA